MKKRHVPNRIDRHDRITLIVSATLLFAYGTFCWVSNHFFLPAYFHRGGRLKGIHLYESAAWFMYGAVICACLIMASVVVDHYDERPNERSYKRFAKVAMYAGFSFFLLSVFAWLTGGA
ncbi:hypothetical protein [Pseudoxanthomonas sp. PXM02]|uniref:hypothetical protein n=1 Tax=Pseudoxanthomonas sp. PXM02 TaxID=2769294 RepID=UPI00177E48E1|nr:hypothetical protein [Pseudoxanthomonas sp. PXM02]MBD9477971.1 hypothetical protein [Pseudoxanthomonas sp. PXM02]